VARGFDGVDQRLTATPTPVTAPPFTMACWFRPENDTDNQVLMGSSTGTVIAADRHLLQLRGDVAGDPLSINSQDGPTTGYVETTTGITPNTWHHACGVFAASNSRSVYLDAGGKATDTTEVTPDDLVLWSIGCQYRADAPTRRLHFTGRIAEAAVWNVALTDVEVAILAAGYSPTFVRPASIVAYWPLIRLLPGMWGDTYPLSAENSPPAEAHAPILYPYGYVTSGRVGAALATLRTLATLGAGR